MADTRVDILRVFRTLHRLKELPRQGFIYFGFKGDETDAIADHSFMVSWIAYVLADELDALGFVGNGNLVSNVIKMALIHDWGEAVAGDLSYRVKGEAFAETEKLAFEALVENLPEKGELTELWNEYDAKKTIASAIVKFADALDAWLQGLVTPTTWWPAWEEYNRRVEKSLAEVDFGLSKLFRRICDIAKDPDVQIRLSPPPDMLLSDTSLWNLLQFIKNIYCLKELPRHGFTIFGMKRSETDSFAGHSFTTACLSYLLSMGMPDVDQSKVIMMALTHDLSVALTGDVSYDLQEFAGKEWLSFEESAIDELVKGLSSHNYKIRDLLQEWNELGSTEAWLVRVAAALDAWEMGITTPTAWMDAWLDYRERNIARLCSKNAPDYILSILTEGYQELAGFEECKLGMTPIGRKPTIQLIRPK